MKGKIKDKEYGVGQGVIILTTIGEWRGQGARGGPRGRPCVGERHAEPLMTKASEVQHIFWFFFQTSPFFMELYPVLPHVRLSFPSLSFSHFREAWYHIVRARIAHSLLSAELKNIPELKKGRFCTNRLRVPFVTSIIQRGWLGCFAHAELKNLRKTLRISVEKQIPKSFQ